MNWRAARVAEETPMRTIMMVAWPGVEMREKPKETKTTITTTATTKLELISEFSKKSQDTRH